MNDDVSVPAGEIDPEAVSGHDDLPGTPWAMQLVVRCVGDTTHEDALEAAAVACVQLIASGHDNPDVAAAVARWESGRIRKTVRRAKEHSGWLRALAVDPHAQVAIVGDTHVAAFTPGPVDMVDKEISRLQVTGLDLPRRGNTHAGARVVTIGLTPYVPMTTGKACAQAAHAAQLAFMAMSSEERQAWQEAGYPLSAAGLDVADWASLAIDADVQVRDAGYTEVPPGTRTALVRISRHPREGGIAR